MSKDYQVKNILYTLLFYEALDYLPTELELFYQLIDYSNFSNLKQLTENSFSNKKDREKVFEKGESEAFLKENKNFSVAEIFSEKQVEIKLEEKSLKEKYEAFLAAIENPKLAQKIERKNGFVGFKKTFNKNQNLLKRRIEKQKISLFKIKRLKKFVFLASFLPYVRGIFLTGTLAMKNAEIKSDWDVLVVLKEKRIWLGRFLITVFFQLFGKRRFGDKIQDRFCLNHFITENSLQIKEKSFFSAGEIAFSLPLLGFDLHGKFLKANKNWMEKIKPNFSFDYQNIYFKDADILFSKIIRALGEKLLDFSGIGYLLNRWCKFWMLKKIKNNPKTYWPNADIQAGDEALIFLPKPKRFEVDKKIKAAVLNFAN